MGLKLTDRIRKCHAVMMDLLTALEGLDGVTNVIVESTYKSELIKYHLFQEKLIKRLEKPRADRTTFRFKAAHRAVIHDESAVKRVRIEEEVEESIASIKRSYGVDLDGMAESRAAFEQEHRHNNPNDVYKTQQVEASRVENASFDDMPEDFLKPQSLTTAAEKRQTSIQSLKQHHQNAAFHASNDVLCDSAISESDFLDTKTTPQHCFPSPYVSSLSINIILPDARTIEHSVACYRYCQ